MNSIGICETFRIGSQNTKPFSVVFFCSQVATPAGLLNGLTLNNLLATALSQSYSGTDPNSNLLSFSVSTVPKHFSHSSPGALDCLHLHYRATWPINLILTEEALEKYNLVR